MKGLSFDILNWKRILISKENSENTIKLVAPFNWLQKGFDFYIKSSIHVALAVYSLLQVICIYFEFDYAEPLSYAVFYGSILGYNFIKYGGIWLKSSLPIIRRPYLFISVLSGFAMGIYLLKLDTKTILVLSSSLLLSIFYIIPFFKKKSLRQFHSLKIYIVALTWTITTTLAPLVYYNASINSNAILIIGCSFLWILCLMIPFEIRDYSIDPIHLKTWPQRYGIRNTKLIGAILTLFLYVSMGCIYSFEIKKALWIQGFIYGITLILILFSKSSQPKYYSSFLVESLPICWWVSLIFI